MAGMINEEMPEEQVPPEQMPGEAMAAEGEELTPESARAQMKMPPELMKVYERVVDGGLRLMFSEQTREQTLQFMQGEGDPAEKMGEGVAAVMATLFKQSNDTMPPQVVIPAGIELLLHAVDVVRKSGGEWSQDDTAESIGTMVEAVFRQFGTSMEDVAGMMQGGGEQAAQQEVPA